MSETTAYRITRKTAKLARAAKAAIQRNGVRVFWWSGVKNFGDLITPYLFERFGVTPVYAPAENAKVVSTGSVLHMMPQDFDGLVLGSGLISGKLGIRLPKAQIAGVRGPLTRDAIGAPEATPLGDPGLLMAKWVKRPGAPRFALGLVTHYHDRANPHILSIAKANPGDVTVIGVQRGARAVSRDIANCGAILSSSLHGMIIADAFGIPAGRLILSGRVEGGDFKFNDHDGALQLSRKPVSLSGHESVSELAQAATQSSRDRIAELQAGLDKAFHSLKDLI